MLLFLQEGVGQLVAKGAVGDEEAAFGVFRQCTKMDPDAGSAGHLAEDGKEPFELRALRHLHFVYQSRNKAVRVLKGRRYGGEVLAVYSGAP